MPFVSASILIFGFLPSVGQLGTTDVVFSSVLFGVGIYLAYLSKNEQQNPNWHLLGFIVFLFYVLLFSLGLVLADWTKITEYWLSNN